MCAAQGCTCCQAYIAEVQLRDVASGQWLANNGTQAHPWVVGTSGEDAPNDAWKAADGTLKHTLLLRLLFSASSPFFKMVNCFWIEI